MVLPGGWPLPRDASVLALPNDAQALAFPGPSPALGRILAPDANGVTILHCGGFGWPKGGSTLRPQS